MGGIGKTQLALEYTKQYAVDYDYNLLWIDAEKKIDIVESFKKLAKRLNIDVNDIYNNEKESAELIEEVYTYFGNAKSLFVFDNAETAGEIQDVLPKASNRNRPTILITSRYSNWKNIALPLVLDVFTETESINFIKSELTLTDADEPNIKELAQLLQNLPLALQQAIAYIKIERNLDNGFTIRNYIACFKEKSQELLDFNFANYGNDPYSKTVFTTWKITLKKLEQEKVFGKKAIEVLQIMAYLCPDHINNQFFLPLPDNELLSIAIQLLKNYSLINEGNMSNISTIHRLVQKVLRINLEKNHDEFESIVQSLIYLTKDFANSKEIMSHYYSFLLHMMQHKELTQALNLSATNKRILEILTHFESDETLLINSFDAAKLTLSRDKYLNFIGEALMLYVRCPFIVSLMNVINYIEKNVNEKQLSLAEANHIFSLQYKAEVNQLYKPARLSRDPATNARQRNAIMLVSMCEHKIFSKEFTICRRNKKRSVASCLPAETEELLRRPLDDLQIKAYFKKVGLAANFANLALFSKDTLSALIQGDFDSVAISFALLSSSRILGKISNKLLMKAEERLALGNEKLLLEKELDYDTKLATSLFSDTEIMLVGKRRFLGNVMKVAAPFVARGTSLLFAYSLVKGLSDNQTDWIDNLSNGAIIGIDLGEASIEGAEYLGFIAEVSEITGPIGEGLGFLTIAGIQLYHVEKELNTIEKWVHLSSREKFVQGLRAFFDLQPSDYLEKKAYNNQLANKIIDFLKLHSEIQRYIFSEWFPTTELPERSFVFLDNKRNVTVIKDKLPEEPQEGHLFCLPGTHSRLHSDVMPWFEERLESFVDSAVESVLGLEERFLYLCLNTIGVEYTANRTSNVTLIAAQRTATVIGPYSDTIFVINEG
ncbi:MAG: NB-ARC domain-containing protein, partial [Rickettsiella sp.]|nr:NB-ARC domain-containing protein [Rickettsiella sp.]